MNNEFCLKLFNKTYSNEIKRVNIPTDSSFLPIPFQFLSFFLK